MVPTGSSVFGVGDHQGEVGAHREAGHPALHPVAGGLRVLARGNRGPANDLGILNEGGDPLHVQVGAQAQAHDAVGQPLDRNLDRAAGSTADQAADPAGSADPARSATRSTISDMIRLISKSFGV